MTLLEIKDVQTMVEKFEDTFPTNTQYIEVEKVDTAQEIETLHVRYGDGNQEFRIEANQKDFITECLEQSNQI